MVRTTSVRLLLATVSTLALNVAAHAEQPASEPATDTRTTESQSTPVAETAVVLDTVTVTASKLKTTAIDAPASISIVDDEELDRYQPENLGDILRSLPGVDTSGGPRSTVQMPTIRGLTDDRVVIRVDGARSNFNSGHKGGLFLDPEVLKKVEVFRGPASTMQGTGALGGVLALQTVTAEDMLEDGERVGGRVKSGYASVDSAVTLNSMAYAKPTNGSDVLVSVSHKNSGNYETGDGLKEEYTDDNYINGLFKGSIDVGETGNLHLSLQRYVDHHVIPASPDSAIDSDTVIVKRKTRQTTGVLGYDYYSASSDLVDAKVNLYGTHTNLRESALSETRLDERDLVTLGAEGSNTSRFELGSTNLAVTLGGEVFEDSQEGRRNGEPTTGFYPDADMLISGVYLDNQFDLTDALQFTAGVRYDSFDLSSSSGNSRTDSALSPRFSASYRVTNWLQPYVSYAEAFNAPSLSQLYNDGVHYTIPGPTPDNYFVPNPNLDPEKAQTWELGANFKVDQLLTSQDSLRAKLALFRNEVTDYIEQTVSSTTTTSSNLPEAEIKGFEADVNYDNGVVFAGLATSILRGENSETGEYLSNIQGDKLSLSGGYRLLDSALELGGRATMVAGQDRVPDDTAKRGGYTRLDLFARWDASDYVDGLQVNAGIDNLLDQTYRTSDAIIYEPGRNFKISASMKF
ncbi:hemoglobin [Thalassospira sp. HJ]|uniref:TonB-dependent hemoglobin/transferrin/lactoferrin family receptor n=1 Tax=Thalassospira sp. HJ TaxID=1616823 RepID=UPI0005CDEAEE|nr:TonB-dependent hemoglobin/transferrin/lactoferrin family receptor [Thalassospira sp. HJ]KJE34098.1 hemoglobin [Thalassospira sp. HJ]